MKRPGCQCARCYDRRVEAFVTGKLPFDDFVSSSPPFSPRLRSVPASCTALQREACTRRPSIFKRVLWAVLDRLNRYVR